MTCFNESKTTAVEVGELIQGGPRLLDQLAAPDSFNAGGL